MTEEIQYILMPASVLALLKIEMVKEGVPTENAKLAQIKLGFLTAQESVRGEKRSQNFDEFKEEVKGKLKSEGLGQVQLVRTTKSGDIQIIVERSIEAQVNKEMKIKGKCNYIAGYLMGIVNSTIPTKRRYICKEIACVNEGTGKNCIFEMKPAGKANKLEIS